MYDGQNSTICGVKRNLMSSNQSKQKQRGRRGEDEAAAYLQKNGYRVLERNWKKHHAEIDIIAIEGDILVFIEVKTRFSDEYGKPEEAMTPWKVKTLERAAYEYKLYHPELPDGLRIDFVGVDYAEGNPRINLIKNITM